MFAVFRKGGKSLKKIEFRRLALPGPVRDLLDLYFEKKVGHYSAALAFYLMLSFFPVLICVTAMLSRFQIADGLLFLLQKLLPQAAVVTIEDYLAYIAGADSQVLLAAGIVLMLTSSAAAFRVLTAAMAGIQGGTRYGGFFGTVFSFLFSIVFLLVIYISCLVILGGEWLLTMIGEVVPIGLFPGIWNWLRFVLLFLLLHGIILGVYRVTAPRESRDVTRRWGALLAALLLVAVSILFSWFVGMSVRYTVVYGSLASVFLLMIWLNLCGNVLIMGNAVNVIAYKYKKK